MKIIRDKLQSLKWEANFGGGGKADISLRYFRKLDFEFNFKLAVKKHKAAATSVMVRQAAKIWRKAPPFLHHI